MINILYVTRGNIDVTQRNEYVIVKKKYVT